MTGRLLQLRSRLGRLRRVRSGLAAFSAWSAFATSIIVALLAVFTLDWLFNLPISQRAVVLVLASVGVAWAFWRFTRPLLGWRESEIDLALAVERQHDIDSDLVAAIQFDANGTASFGSRQLTGAVVDYVSQASPQINVFQGLSTDQFFRRAAALAASFAVIAILAVLAPGHVAAFASRLFLSSRHYPTRTRIDQLLVNQTPVLTSAPHDLTPAEAKAAQGQPLLFEVNCAGSSPSSVFVDLQPAGNSSPGTRVALKAESGRLGVYQGQLSRLSEDVTYRLTAGDATTGRGVIHIIPLPIVELRVSATPPAYARSKATPPDASGRQAAFLEGSSVDLVVECVNKKPLQTVRIATVSAPNNQPIDLVPQDAARLRWSLPADSTPLANIRRELRYKLDVIDADGLRPQVPIQGVIRVRPDLPPNSIAQMVHRVVLPTAAPVVAYRATDDYGIAAISLIVDVERQARDVRPATAASETSGASPTAQRVAETHRFDIPLSKSPLVDDQLPATGSYALPLSPLNLVKGDRLKLALEVTDFRGDNGENSLSDALLLEVSDEAGVLAAIGQADQRSEAALTEIINRQLGVGGAP